MAAKFTLSNSAYTLVAAVGRPILNFRGNDICRIYIGSSLPAFDTDSYFTAASRFGPLDLQTLEPGQQVYARAETGSTVVEVINPATPRTTWFYAPPANGIVNSAVAVTVKAAAGAGLRNYLKTMDVVHDTLGAATEFSILDGAGGNVLYRGRVQTAAKESGGAITFDPPLFTTANTALVVQLGAAVTGGVYFNMQGYVGA